MRSIWFILILLLLVASCKESDPKPREPDPPSEVKLIFPFENSECNEGTDITDTQSTVLFEWLESENTDSYELNMQNLLSKEKFTFPSVDTKIPVVLQRATPYAWYVIAYSNETDSTSQSETWKFYNTGDGLEFYAPFPADIIFPLMAQSVNAPGGNVTLNWEGTDVDNDIESFDVYFGSEADPPLLSNVTASQLNVSVAPGTIYYWSVTTIDEQGHESKSGVFQFRVL